jgi:trans-aconitate methyltransferase
MAWHALGASCDSVADRYEERFVEELDVKPKDRELLVAFADATCGPVVDLGCGPGQVGKFVGERVPFVATLFGIEELASALGSAGWS